MPATLPLPATAPKPGRAVDREERLNLACACGQSGSLYLKHWQRVRCNCGRTWWALQPKRNGPFELFPWPGDYQQRAAS